MPIFDIFKKREKVKEKKRKPEEKKDLKNEKKPAVVKIPQAKKPTKKPIKISKTAYKVLRVPHVTEKATSLVGKNQYVFKIWSDSNKKEVKKAVESVFGVEVTAVKIINVPKKKRRLGRIKGFRKGYKKAIIRIREGQKIELLPK